MNDTQQPTFEEVFTAWTTWTGGMKSIDFIASENWIRLNWNVDQETAKEIFLRIYKKVSEIK
jgi:hypothetical protein